MHRWIGFPCLGGGCLVLTPLALQMPASAVPAIFAPLLLAATVVNHPHFAASCQIFCRSYRRNACGDRLGLGMRLRYLFAGIVVPATAILFLASSMDHLIRRRGDPDTARSVRRVKEMTVRHRRAGHSLTAATASAMVG